MPCKGQGAPLAQAMSLYLESSNKGYFGAKASKQIPNSTLCPIQGLQLKSNGCPKVIPSTLLRGSWSRFLGRSTLCPTPPPGRSLRTPLCPEETCIGMGMTHHTHFTHLPKAAAQWGRGCSPSLWQHQRTEEYSVTKTSLSHQLQD